MLKIRGQKLQCYKLHCDCDRDLFQRLARFTRLVEFCTEENLVYTFIETFAESESLNIFARVLQVKLSLSARVSLMDYPQNSNVTNCHCHCHCLLLPTHHFLHILLIQIFIRQLHNSICSNIFYSAN